MRSIIVLSMLVTIAHGRSLDSSRLFATDEEPVAGKPIEAISGLDSGGVVSTKNAETVGKALSVLNFKADKNADASVDTQSGSELNYRSGDFQSSSDSEFDVTRRVAYATYSPNLFQSNAFNNFVSSEYPNDSELNGRLNRSPVNNTAMQNIDNQEPIKNNNFNSYTLKETNFAGRPSSLRLDGFHNRLNTANKNIDFDIPVTNEKIISGDEQNEHKNRTTHSNRIMLSEDSLVDNRFKVNKNRPDLTLLPSKIFLPPDINLAGVRYISPLREAIESHIFAPTALDSNVNKNRNYSFAASPTHLTITDRRNENHSQQETINEIAKEPSVTRAESQKAEDVRTRFFFYSAPEEEEKSDDSIRFQLRNILEKNYQLVFLAGPIVDPVYYAVLKLASEALEQEPRVFVLKQPVPRIDLVPNKPNKVGVDNIWNPVQNSNIDGRYERARSLAAFPNVKQY